MTVAQMSLFDATIQQQFESFHTRHPEVLRQIMGMAYDLQRRGHTRIGIGMLFEVLRWQHMTAADPAEAFRLNNNYRSRYVRLICDLDADLGDLFEQRELRA